MPAHVFGVFMSVHPVLAALAGLVLLGQVLGAHEWAGIAIVVTVNAVAVVVHRFKSVAERGDGNRTPLPAT